MLTASELERELAAVVGMIRKLSPPLSHKPHLFLEQKDELAHYVERLRDAHAGRAPSERFFTTPARDTGLTRVRHSGREIRVERRGRT